jgi:predicted membrane channel-forming protein YqfA (hemolysin III family)
LGRDCNKQTLRFDTRTLKWKEIVDYASEYTIIVPSGITFHVLVFVVRTLLRWMISVISTKGVAPALILNELVAKVISYL